MAQRHATAQKIMPTINTGSLPNSLSPCCCKFASLLTGGGSNIHSAAMMLRIRAAKCSQLTIRLLMVNCHILIADIPPYGCVGLDPSYGAVVPSSSLLSGHRLLSGIQKAYDASVFAVRRWSVVMSEVILDVKKPSFAFRGLLHCLGCGGSYPEPRVSRVGNMVAHPALQDQMLRGEIPE